MHPASNSVKYFGLYAIATGIDCAAPYFYVVQFVIPFRDLDKM